MIDHVKHISKRKVPLDGILQKDNKTSAIYLSKKALKLEVNPMIMKWLIVQNNIELRNLG